MLGPPVEVRRRDMATRPVAGAKRSGETVFARGQDPHVGGELPEPFATFHVHDAPAGREEERLLTGIDQEDNASGLTSDLERPGFTVRQSPCVEPPLAARLGGLPGPRGVGRVRLWSRHGAIRPRCFPHENPRMAVDHERPCDRRLIHWSRAKSKSKLFR